MVHEIAAPIQSSAARGVTARDAQLLHIDAASASSRYAHQYCITVSTLSESSSSERLPQRPNPGYFHMMVIQKAPENRFCERWLPDLSIAPSPLRGCTSVPPSGLSIRIIPFPAVTEPHFDSPFQAKTQAKRSSSALGRRCFGLAMEPRRASRKVP